MAALLAAIRIMQGRRQSSGVRRCRAVDANRAPDKEIKKGP